MFLTLNLLRTGGVLDHVVFGEEPRLFCLGGNVTQFAPDKALKSITSVQVDFDERVVIHCAAGGVLDHVVPGEEPRPLLMK